MLVTVLSLCPTQGQSLLEVSLVLQGEKEEERGQEGSDTTGLEGVRKTQAEREKVAWVQGGQETNARGVRELRRFLAVTGSEERALI